MILPLPFFDLHIRLRRRRDVLDRALRRCDTRKVGTVIEERRDLARRVLREEVGRG